MLCCGGKNLNDALSNVETLQTANSHQKNRRRSISIVQKKLRKSVKFITEHLPSKKKATLDLDLHCMKTAEECVQLLSYYIEQLLKWKKQSSKAESYKLSTSACQIIDDLSNVSNQMSTYSSQKIFDTVFQQNIKNVLEMHNKTRTTLLQQKDLLSNVFKNFENNSQSAIKHAKPRDRVRWRQANIICLTNDVNILNTSALITNTNSNTENNNMHKISTFGRLIMSKNHLDLQKILSHQLDTWDDANIFEIDAFCDGYTLMLYLPIMMERFGFLYDLHQILKQSKPLENNIQNMRSARFSMDEIDDDENFSSYNNVGSQPIMIDRNTLYKFLLRVSTEGYHNLPYHTTIHAADVLQTVFYWVTRTDSLVLDLLTDEDKCAMLIGAVIHDFQHPGISHPYLIQTDHISRYLYNDTDVLENIHLCQAFKVMKEINLFEHMNRQQIKIIKKFIVDSVLATNFGHQNELIYEMEHSSEKLDLNAAIAAHETMNKNKLKKDTAKHAIQLSYKQTSHIRKILRPLLMHASDISHCCKKLDIHKEWSERYFQEFFVEKKMLKAKGILQQGVSRRDFPSEQVLFFKLWCMPLYNILCEWVRFSESDKILDTAQSNFEYWANNSKANSAVEMSGELNKKQEEIHRLYAAKRTRNRNSSYSSNNTAEHLSSVNIFGANWASHLTSTKS